MNITVDAVIIFMIVASLAAIEAKNMLSAVIALGTAGLGLCLTFLLLKAPDLAVILLIVELVTLSTLTRSLSARGGEDISDDVGAPSRLVVIGFIAVFIAVALQAISELPRFGMPVLAAAGEYIERAYAATSASSMVAAVALEYRRLDLLAILFIMFILSIAVWHITTPDHGEGDEP